MKIATSIAVFVCFLVLAPSTYSQNKVVVVPLGGDTTNLVLSPNSIVSSIGTFAADQLDTGAIYTVPNGKTFVLTDVTKNHFSSMLVLADGEVAFALVGAATHERFNSGLVFQSGSLIKAIVTTVRALTQNLNT